MTVLALVPARDEADRVADTVRALGAFVDRVLVVDDGSRDDTAGQATKAGADVLRVARPIGKGGALERLLARAGHGADIVVFADADLGSTAVHLQRLIDAVRSGSADMAVAVFPPQGGGFGTVKRSAGWAVRRLGGHPVREPLSGQRAFTADALAKLRPLAPGFGVETALGIDAARRGLRIVEIPLELRHRATRRDISGFLHRGRQGWDILRAVATRMRPERGR